MVRVMGSILALLGSVIFLMASHGLGSTLIPLTGEVYGFSATMIGTTASGYFAGFIAGCLGAPYAIKRAGHIRAFAAMVSLASVVGLLYPIFIDVYVWFLFRFLYGFCVAGFYMIIESWLNERTDNENRGTVMSAYIVLSFSALMAGQWMVALGDPGSFVLFSLASILASLAVIPLAMTVTPQPAPLQIVKFNFRVVYQRSPAAFVLMLMVGVTTGSSWIMAPVYARGLGFSASEAAIFGSTLILGGLLVQWPLGRISDRIDRRLVLVLLAAVASLLSLALMLLNSSVSLTWLLALGVLFGAFTQPAYAIASAHAYDSAEPGEFVQTSMVLLLCHSIGATVGTTPASWLMDIFAPGALFGFLMVVQFVVVGYLMIRIRIKSSKKTSEKEAFDYATTAQVGIAMPVDHSAGKDADTYHPTGAK